MIYLITPTGARPNQLALCAKWMQNQTYSGAVCWVIVDDCQPNTARSIIPEDFRKNWKVVHITPEYIWSPGMNTQGENMKILLNYVKNENNVDGVFVIEDDDYYSPRFIETTYKYLKTYELVGENRTIYYSLNSKGWIRNGNTQHSSLFQTAFRKSFIPTIEKCCNQKYIDIHAWRMARNKLLFNEQLSIGIKGMKGRGGIGNGHRNDANYIKDNSYNKLKSFVGDDYKWYLREILRMNEQSE